MSPVYTERPHITELPYFREGINFMAPQTDLPTVWDSYHNEHSRPAHESYETRVTMPTRPRTTSVSLLLPVEIPAFAGMTEE